MEIRTPKKPERLNINGNRVQLIHTSPKEKLQGVRQLLCLYKAGELPFDTLLVRL